MVVQSFEGAGPLEQFTSMLRSSGRCIHWSDSLVEFDNWGVASLGVDDVYKQTHMNCTYAFEIKIVRCSFQLRSVGGTGLCS